MLAQNVVNMYSLNRVQSADKQNLFSGGSDEAHADEDDATMNKERRDNHTHIPT